MVSVPLAEELGGDGGGRSAAGAGGILVLVLLLVLVVVVALVLVGVTLALVLVLVLLLLVLVSLLLILILLRLVRLLCEGVCLVVVCLFVCLEVIQNHNESFSVCSEVPYIQCLIQFEANYASPNLFLSYLAQFANVLSICQDENDGGMRCK